MVFAAFPRSGPPPRFKDYADYAEVVGQLERTGCIADYTHIWWDIRLHPRLGTIEIRICDAVTQLEDVVAITAYCQALVKHYSERFDAGEEIPSFHRILTTENKWLAARYGLEAPVMDLVTGQAEPDGGRAGRAPDAEADRAAREGARLRGASSPASSEILRRGNGADRQLRVFNANRDIVEVVREIAELTEIARADPRLPPRRVSACWPSATGSRRRVVWTTPQESGDARRSSSPTGRSCCSSTSSTGRRPERTSWSSCVTGATSSAPPACSRTRRRATRRGRTSRGCRRSTSTCRCSPTGTPTRRAASASRSTTAA